MDVLVIVVVAPRPEDVDCLSDETMPLSRPILWYWAYMLRGWSEAQGSKNRLGLWTAEAAAEELGVKSGGRLLISRVGDD
jgi:hypothetical protein